MEKMWKKIWDSSFLYFFYLTYFFFHYVDSSVLFLWYFFGWFFFRFFFNLYLLSFFDDDISVHTHSSTMIVVIFWLYFIAKYKRMIEFWLYGPVIFYNFFTHIFFFLKKLFFSAIIGHLFLTSEFFWQKNQNSAQCWSNIYM